MNNVEFKITNNFPISTERDSSQKLSILVYFFLLLIFSVSTFISTLLNKGSGYLSLLVIFYWAVATFPLVLTRMNLTHPLILQMLFEIPRVMSLVMRASGYLPLNQNWTTNISISACTNAYIKGIFITCLGLIIEYIIVCRFRFKHKVYNIWLKNNGSAFALIFVAFISFLLLLRGLGGITNVLVHYKDRLSEFSGDTNMYLRLAIILGIISTLYYYLIEEKRKFVLNCFLQIFMYFVLGERGGLLVFLFLPLFIVIQLSNNTRLSLFKIVVVGIVAIFLYELISIFRDAPNFTTADFSIELFFSRVLNTFGNVRHFVISSELIYLIDAGQVKHTLGKPLLNILFAAFPRRYFPWKPTYISESALVGSLILNRDFRVSGMPPGNFAYGYLNFGIFGVVLVSLISGFFMRWLYFSFIKPYWNKKDIPNGNILLYSLLVGNAYSIVSTDVQIKVIILVIGFLYIELTARRRAKRKY